MSRSATIDLHVAFGLNRNAFCIIFAVGIRSGSTA
jgi:hypothetical protein